MKSARLIFLLLRTCRLAGADAPPALRDALASWLGVPDRWAFTQRAAWARRKFRRRPRKFDSPIGEFFHFSRARVLSESGRTLRFDLPLRGANNGLFSTNKVDVTVAVNKEARALEHLTARVREPFRVLLEIARIAWGKLDLDFEETEAVPAPAEPSGTAEMSLSR